MQVPYPPRLRDQQHGILTAAVGVSGTVRRDRNDIALQERHDVKFFHTQIPAIDVPNRGIQPGPTRSRAVHDNTSPIRFSL